jgi:Flp pilus assembly protein TadG
MKIVGDLHGQAMAFMRGSSRAAAPNSARAEGRSIGNRLRAWLGARDEGQALVEFAVVLPMLLVVTTGVLIFGIYELQILSLLEGVEDAGRVLAVSAGETLDPCTTAATTMKNSATLLNPANLSYTIVLNNNVSTDTLSGNTSTGPFCSSSSTTTGAAGYLVSGGSVTVTGTFNACSLKIFRTNYSPGTCSISESITEVVQ